MAADRTPTDLADALEADAESLHNLDDMAYDGKEARLRAAAVLLRRQGEQLDTLRAAIGDPDNLRLLADTFDLPILHRIADAVDALAAVGDPEEGR